MRKILAPLAFVLLITFMIMGGLLLFGGGGHKGTSVLKFRLGNVHGTPPTTVTVPKATVEKAAAAFEDKSLRSENPAGVPAKVLDAAQVYAEKLAANDQLPIVTPLAAPQQRGCITQLVQNYSSRRGVAPREFILHWTGSNTQGWVGVNAIAGLFDRPSFAASSNYVLDANGLCKYIVRETDKAWTQAAANPFSISVEVINPGSGLGPYLAPAGLHKLAMIVSDALDRWKIPLQRGRVVNCIPVTPGITDHTSLGPCGGGHPDITTRYPHGIDQVIAAVKAFRTKTPPKARPVLFLVVAWQKGSTKKLTTGTPGFTVRQLIRQHYTRISVVRVKRK